MAVARSRKKCGATMQAALQPFVDSAISKTVAVPPGYSFESFARLLDRAWDLGLKGLTAFPLDPSREHVLAPADATCAVCVERA